MWIFHYDHGHWYEALCNIKVNIDDILNICVSHPLPMAHLVLRTLRKEAYLLTMPIDEHTMFPENLWPDGLSK